MNEITDVTPTITDAIIEESVIVEREMSEDEAIRYNYERAYPDEYKDDVFHVDMFSLSTMDHDPNRPKKNSEGTYTSSRCMLDCYNDEMELKMRFFIENFNNYNPETGSLILQGKNVLARLVKKIRGTDSNRFKVNYDTLVEVVNNTHDLDITIKEYVRNDYPDYTIE